MDAVEIAMDIVGEYPTYYGMSNFKETADQYKVETIDNGGAEGDGAEAWWILEVTDGKETKHVRYVGYYSSWDDGEVDSRPELVELYTVKRQEWLSAEEAKSNKKAIIKD